MKISIVIPTYEAKGRGVSLLTDLINSILTQTYKNFELVISDQSVNDDILNYINKIKESTDLDIVYNRVSFGYGNSSINMNEGIKKSTGEYIKIMHMDDKFCSDDSLELMVDSILKSNKQIKWGGFGFNHHYENENRVYREIIPHIYFNPIIKNVSMIGCPSVSFFINDENFFDERFIIINDFDIYYQLRKKYGEPFVINKICVTIRMHSSQVTNILSNYNELEQKEADIFNTKI